MLRGLISVPAFLLGAMLVSSCGGESANPDELFGRTTPTLEVEPTVAANGDGSESTPEAGDNAGGGEQTYVIQPGDTLNAIAQQFGVTVEAIVEANEITDPDRIQPDDEILIPVSADE